MKSEANAWKSFEISHIRLGIEATSFILARKRYFRPRPHLAFFGGEDKKGKSSDKKALMLREM